MSRTAWARFGQLISYGCSIASLTCVLIITFEQPTIIITTVSPTPFIILQTSKPPILSTPCFRLQQQVQQKSSRSSSVFFKMPCCVVSKFHKAFDCVIPAPKIPLTIAACLPRRKKTSVSVRGDHPSHFVNGARDIVDTTAKAWCVLGIYVNFEPYSPTDYGLGLEELRRLVYLYNRYLELYGQERRLRFGPVRLDVEVEP